MGVAALHERRLHYPNYWGGWMFAPFAIALGVFVLVIVVVKWRSFSQAAPRPGGKAARRQERALRVVRRAKISDHGIREPTRLTTEEGQP